jgi:hypothetical protein
MNIRTRILAVGAVAAGSVLGLPALPAAAGPDASGRFAVEYESFDETYPVADFCGLGIEVTIHESGRFRGFATFRGAQSIPYFTGTFHGRTTFTEPDGTTVTVTGNTVSKDRRIEVDGNLLIITGMSAGGFKISGPAGMLRNPGMIAYQFVVDSKGTFQDPDDDELVEDRGPLRPSTGLNETTDLCTDYLVVTGRTG